MKKITLLAGACVLFAAQSLVAQEAQEIQYVEDPAQGVLVNDFKDNWFITLQGGGNVLFTHADGSRDFLDRISPNAGLYVGKWFTPVFGARVGVEALWLKGMGNEGASGWLPNEHMTEGHYKTRQLALGGGVDVMANLTNLFCGYKADRVYNATLYIGGAGYWTLDRALDAKGDVDGWEDGSNKTVSLRAGLINSFRVSDRVNLLLDLRASSLENLCDNGGSRRSGLDVQAYVGLTYNFGKSTWSAPVVPVCPPAENCDALRARLSAADSRIADLEAQLRDCLNRPVQVVNEVVEKAPVATIYYPIGVSRISREDNNVLGAIAEVMKADTSVKYVLTGWADNYTGSDAVNQRLRQARVDGVYNKLVKLGVDKGQITATVNNGSLCGDLGEKYVSLDRAVTIEVAE